MGVGTRADRDRATVAVATPANIPRPGDFSGGPGDSLQPALIPASDRL
jgi:hypothetical protein